MSRYWDTSGLIRAYLKGWKPDGLTRSHSISEFLCVLTGPGVMKEKNGQLVKQVLPPNIAAQEARSLFNRMTFVDLDGQKTLDAGDALAKIPNVKGVKVHDFMHAYAAEQNQAEAIVTLNLKDFVAMTKLPLEMPSEQNAA